MQFSFRLPVATHILLCIERFKDEYKTTSTFLASSVNVNPVIIRKTLGQLKAAGLVEVVLYSSLNRSIQSNICVATGRRHENCMQKPPLCSRCTIQYYITYKMSTQIPQQPMTMMKSCAADFLL